MLETFAESLLSGVGKIGDLLRGARANSLAEYTQSAHILPVFLMDQSTSALPEAEDMVGAMLNYWAACYLMAANQSVNIGAINVTRQLEKLNNRRSPTNAGINTINHLLAMESYRNGLPPVTPETLKLENRNNRNQPSNFEMTAQSSNRIADRIQENTKLSVGKTIDVEWSSQGERGTITVLIRPSIQVASNESMINILSIGTRNVSFKERWHGVKSGQLHWFADGILATDIIKDMRKARMTDNTGYYADALARSRKNKLSAILSLNPSVATFSTVFFATADNIRDFETRTNLNLENFSDRQKVFENSYGMVLVVVDPAWKNCRIYTHGIEDHTTVSFSQMAAVNKGKGGEIKELMNAMMMSQAPRF